MVTEATDHTDDHSTRKKLFHSAMKGDWDEVKRIYNRNRNVHKEKITRSGSTALHIAVSDGQEDIVEELVSIIHEAAKIDAKETEAEILKIEEGPEEEILKIEEGPEKEILKIETEAFGVQDERGNTPLHSAAELGSERMCYCIASKNPSLIGARNRDGETPFLLAALHGCKDAFLCLHLVCGVKQGYSYSRRNDGDTVLHCAISGDYFDLAFQIIRLYPNLVNTFNERGQSPLHLLAAKPSAFRSGSHLGRLKSIIYHCIFVDKLQEVRVDSIDVSYLKSKANAKKPDDWPENYGTCCNFINILKDGVKGVIGRGSSTQKGDEGKHRASKGSSATAGDTGRNVTETGKEEGDQENQFEASENGSSSSQHQSKSTVEKETKYGLLGYKAFLNLVITRLEAVAKEEEQSSDEEQSRRLFPRNYNSIFEFVKLASKGMLIILGLGSNEIKKLRDKKQKHTWSAQILDQLLENVSTYEYEDDGAKPLLPGPYQAEDATKPYEIGESGNVTFAPGIVQENAQIGAVLPNEKMNEGTIAEDTIKQGKKEGEKTTILLALKNINGSTNIIEKIQEQFPVAIHDTNTQKKVLMSAEDMEKIITKEMIKKETPILIAAKNGITEIVERILHQYPVAIHDTNSDKKNIVLLTVENRQPHVYELLLKITPMKDSVFRKVDNKGNSALHLAATLGEHKPWLIPGAALQMQWELKWYEFVKESMPFHFFVRYNNDNKTPKDILTETHKDLVKAGGEWLTSTSESCSVVAALIATVAFATSSTVPGGVRAESGRPTLENEPAFNVFAISSLVALCFSVTAVVMFLSILTSRYQEKDFAKDLPRKLLIGLTSLFVSIASMLLSFCAGHFFVLKDKLKYAAFPVYAVTCLPVTFFAIAQFPLYFDLIWATFKKVPQRSYKSIPL